jgi:hypothetical protein
VFLSGLLDWSTDDFMQAVHDGLHGMGLELNPNTESTSTTAGNDDNFTSLPPLPPSPLASTSLALEDISSEHALVDLVDPLSRRAFVDSLEFTLRSTHMVDHSAESTQRAVLGSVNIEAAGGVTAGPSERSSIGLEESIVVENMLTMEEMTGAEDLSASWEDVSAE